MSNASPSNRRTPSRVPRRGLAALVLTATATALLFSFKTPSEMFASGPASTLTAGMAPLAMEPLSTVTVAAAGGSASSEAPSSPLPATEPPATEPPATAPPATAAQATEPPATEVPPTPAAATEPLAEQVVPGQVVRTPYGPVQVEVTVGPSGIVDVQALQLPYDRAYSARISRIVEPMLRDEALQAQSANVDLISGATYTSTGYAMSLQSALDQAAASMTAPA
jgi:uncharacterized protein with FMN-binding domain